MFTQRIVEGNKGRVFQESEPVAWGNCPALYVRRVRPRAVGSKLGRIDQIFRWDIRVKSLN